MDAQLIAPTGLGSDPLKAILQEGLMTLGARSDGLIELEGQTPCVNMTLDEKGDLAAGVAQTDLVEQMTSAEVSARLKRCPYMRLMLFTDHRQATFIEARSRVHRRQCLSRYITRRPLVLRQGGSPK